jgi:hypothetical protein
MLAAPPAQILVEEREAMNRMYALMLALGAGLFVVGCDEAADRTRDLLREQQSKAIQGASDAARKSLDETRTAASESVGDALKGDKEEDAAAKELKGDEK